MRFTTRYAQMMNESKISEVASKIWSLLGKVKHYIIEMFPDEKHLKNDIVDYFDCEDEEKCKNLEKEIEALTNDYEDSLKFYYLNAFKDVKRIKEAQLHHEDPAPGDIINAVYFIKELIEDLEKLHGRKVHESLDKLEELKKELEEIEELAKTLKED